MTSRFSYNSLFLAVCCLLIFTFSAEAQRKKPVKTKPQKNTIVAAHQFPELVMPDSDTSYVVQLDNAGLASVNLPSGEMKMDITVEALGKLLKTDMAKMKAGTRPVVVLESHADNKLSAIINAINAIHTHTAFPIKLRTDEGTFVALPYQSKQPNLPIRPNPLNIVAVLERGGAIRLNYESFGTWPDLTKLQDKLKAVFRSREDNGVFRRGTDLVETTVWVKVPLSTSWGDTAKLILAIRDSGSDLIGLWIEDLEK